MSTLSHDSRASELLQRASLILRYCLWVVGQVEGVGCGSVVRGGFKTIHFYLQFACKLKCESLLRFLTNPNPPHHHQVFFMCAFCMPLGSLADFEELLVWNRQNKVVPSCQSWDGQHCHWSQDAINYNINEWRDNTWYADDTPCHDALHQFMYSFEETKKLACFSTVSIHRMVSTCLYPVVSCNLEPNKNLLILCTVAFIIHPSQWSTLRTCL